MGKFISILLIVFIVFFIVQQSNLMETKKVMDARLGVATEQYSVNWDNLGKYFIEIKKKIEKMMSRRHHRSSYELSVNVLRVS